MDTQTLSGPLGFRATATPQSYTGFTYNASISNASGTIANNSTLVLNLYYDRNMYTLSYDANTGSGTMASQSGKFEAAVTAATNEFTKTNYDFIGWNTQANGGGVACDEGANLTLTGNVTLFAQWQEKAQYSVSYDENGGSGTMSDPLSPYYDGASFTVLDNGFAAPENKHFTGWNTQTDGGGVAYAVGSLHVISDNVTMFAQWEYNDQYTVTYYGNNGSGSTIDNHSPYYEGNTVTIQANGFTYFGYEFTEWNTEENGNGTSYNPGDTFPIADDVKLFAQWEKDPSLWYNVSYNGNGYMGGVVPTDSEEYLSGSTVAVKPGVPLRNGAVFLGWSTTQHALVTMQTQADTVVFVGSTFVIMSDTTLYAVWAQDVNGPDGGSDDVPDYQQYGIAYDDNDATGGSVPINSNIYSPGASAPVEGNTGGLVKTDAVFLGWSTTAAELVKQAADVPTPLYVGGNAITMVTDGVTLHAVWAIDENGPDGEPDDVPDYLEFSVTYDKNSTDATGTITDGHIYPDNYTVTVKGNGFALTNYVFDHWNTESDDTGTNAVPASTFKIHSDIAFPCNLGAG